MCDGHAHPSGCRRNHGVVAPIPELRPHPLGEPPALQRPSTGGSQHKWPAHNPSGRRMWCSTPVARQHHHTTPPPGGPRTASTPPGAPTRPGRPARHPPGGGLDPHGTPLAAKPARDKRPATPLALPPGDATPQGVPTGVEDCPKAARRGEQRRCDPPGGPRTPRSRHAARCVLTCVEIGATRCISQGAGGQRAVDLFDAGRGCREDCQEGGFAKRARLDETHV